MVLSRPARHSAVTAVTAVVGRFARAAAACGLVAAGLALPAGATEGPDSRSATAKAPAKAGAPVPAGAPVSVPPGKDPLDHLRERLADKLGGEVKPRPTRSAPVVVKVVNKSEAEHAAASARPAPPARPAPRTAPELAGSLEPAPRLAALHRETPAQPMPGAPSALVPATLGAPSAPMHDAPHWAYQGEGGPQAWAQLKAEFAVCANGRRQSPIDIRDGLKLQLDPVQFNYGPSEVSVIDTGHTVQVNVAEGNSIEVRGRRYELQQFHFHRPSEERIDGRQFDMVAHLVHKDDEGRPAVVAVLLTRGAAQPLIQTVWNNLPLEKGQAQPVRVPMDLNALLPAERQYYTYMGSLTTPPCTEGVLWMVMKTPVQVSPEQIGVFSRLYPMNARPIQALGGRVIQESN